MIAAPVTDTVPISTPLANFRAGKIGIYPGIDFEEYLRCPLMHQSVLKQGAESMLHLKYAIDHHGDLEVTDAMTLGSALHCAFLEPALMPTKVALWEGPRRAGKEWDAFEEEHAGKAILTKGMHAKLIGMIKALRRHPQIKPWLSRIEDTEVSAIGVIQGVKFCGRADALTDDPLWDLKKTTCTDDATIGRTIETYGYHLQAHIYGELFNRKRFCLGFVEEQPPHDVRVIELGEGWMKIGKAEVTRLIQQYQWSVKHDHWPGRSDKIDVIEPNNWQMENSGVASEVTIGGEKAF